MQNEIPEIYESDEVPLDRKVIHQVYVVPSVRFYWLIAELDKRENIAFGFANLNNDTFAEWGYIPIMELLENGALLVKDWKPCRFPEAKKAVEELLESEKLSDFAFTDEPKTRRMKGDVNGE